MYEKILATSHWSAVKAWNIPYAGDLFADELVVCEREQQVTVFKANHRFQRPGYRVHCCQIPAVSSSYTWLRTGYVVSLDFLFVQLAYDLGVQKTILMGMLMCSAPDGGTPLITPEELYAFAFRAKGLRGRRIALRALRYIKGGCRSPMEALTFMFLNNPHLLGGAKLGLGAFNYKIHTPPTVKKRYYYADICYPQAKLVVEYYGKDYHLGREKEDSEREDVLRSLGYKVQVLDKYRVYPLEKFIDEVRNLAKILKKRIRVQTQKFESMFAKLRKLLPRNNSNDYKLAPYEEEQEIRSFTRDLMGLEPEPLYHYYT